MKHIEKLLKQESSSKSITHQVPDKVIVGSDAYWALESTQESLRRDVASARKHILQTLERLRERDGQNSKDHGFFYTRAVIVFMPGSLSKQYAREFRALFLSWVRVRQEQRKGFKTDLVVVTPEENLKRLSDLGCTTEVRNNSAQNEGCVISLYTPLLQRKVPDGVAFDPLTKYKVIDSMLCLAEYVGYEYDAVMRCDLDTFLMPGFADWTPPSQETLVVGRGGYGSKNALAHLKYVSQSLGLDTKDGLINLGSTWFGDTGLMVATARLTIAVMRWMHIQEFSTYERCCSGVLSWTHWHWPVLLLYGGHVALNQVGSMSSVAVSNDTNGRMDFFSTSNISISDRSIKECSNQSSILEFIILHITGCPSRLRTFVE